MASQIGRYEPCFVKTHVSEPEQAQAHADG